jgi:hypothetical protein
MDDTLVKTVLGVPGGVVYEVPLDNQAVSYEVQGIMDQEPFMQSEMVYLANYLEADQDVPMHMAGGTGEAGVGFATYRYSCLNHAYEVISRIDMTARTWTTEAEFAKFVAGNAANNRLTGNEGAPFADEPIEDYRDWLLLQLGSVGLDSGDFYLNVGVTSSEQLMYNFDEANDYFYRGFARY